MKIKKTAGIVILAIGIVVMLVFLLADVIGLGSYPGIGYKQLRLIIAGAIVAVVGLVLTLT